MSEYSCGDIQVLKSHEAVRKRPGMYVGDMTTSDGLEALVWTVFDGVLEEHLAGYTSELRVELGPDAWITIHDDGVGIPTDEVPEQGDDGVTNALEALLCRLHCGRKFQRDYPRLAKSGGLHGVGLAVVNALSEELVVETTYQGVRWSQSFARGERVARLRRFGATKLVGTTIRFRPDRAIFASTRVDPQRIRRRLHELAFLYPHLRVWFQERRMGCRGGIAEWARCMANERGAIVASFSMVQSIGDTHTRMAFVWNETGRPWLRSFVNDYPTKRGSHEDGMWAGFCEYARIMDSPARGNSHVREAVGCGFVAVIQVTTADARFTSMQRDELRSDAVREAVRATVLAGLDGETAWGLRRFVDDRLLVDRTRR